MVLFESKKGREKFRVLKKDDMNRIPGKKLRPSSQVAIFIVTIATFTLTGVFHLL